MRKLEDGSMRADVNISVRLHGSESFGTKLKLKTLIQSAMLVKRLIMKLNAKQTYC